MFELSNYFYDSLQDILCDIPFTRKTSKGSISEISSVFDIECTSFYYNENKASTMYAWVFGINGKCIRGRTWDEFLQVINVITETYSITPKKRFIIYVHNLSYEFQFIKDLFKWEKVFAIEERTPLYAITTTGIEFRCSYLLSGYSLKVVGENLRKYKVKKMVGDLDYDLLRHSSTPLTEKEWGYILNDGLVVMAYIQEEMERLGGIKKMPLTKTGHVRNLLKVKCFGKDTTNMYRGGTNTPIAHWLKLDPTTYNQLKQTFQGGFTHANARKVGKTYNNVQSYDFTSSYPAVMVSELFPMSNPVKVDIKDMEEFNTYIRKYSCMFKVHFTNINSKITYDHYISKSKCTSLFNYVEDNGRIDEAEELELYITEIDYKIISKCYEWDNIYVKDFYYFRRHYLPKDIIEVIIDLYNDKTKLKGIEEEEERYMWAKELLNSVYGCSVTDPCKNVITYIDEWTTEESNIIDLVENYNKNPTRTLYYAWGIWVTAYARRNLWSGILECKDDYIYSDTDSLKITNGKDHEPYFKWYNDYVQSKIKKCLSYYEIPKSKASPKTIKGVRKPLGVWDYEGEYSMFKTLGAKKYIYVNHDELHITISGVAKKKGAEYLLWKYKTFDNIFKHFKENLVFPSIYYVKDEKTKEKKKIVLGKLTHTYIDEPYTAQLVDYKGNMMEVSEKSCIHLEPTEYTMGLSNDFINYLFSIED